MVKTARGRDHGHAVPARLTVEEIESLRGRERLVAVVKAGFKLVLGEFMMFPAYNILRVAHPN